MIKLGIISTYRTAHVLTDCQLADPMPSKIRFDYYSQKDL